MADKKIDEVADELYALPPAEFIAARDAHAAKSPDKELAKQISALRKPTTAAWAVNQLVRKGSPELTEALELGARLRAAQEQLRGRELRELSKRRRELVNELTEQAGELAGGQLGNEAQLQVRNTFGAALAEPDLADRLRTGRLTKALEHSGFGPLSAFAPAPEPEPEFPGDDLAARREKRRQRQVAEARGALADARHEVEEARRAERAAMSEHAKRERRTDELREELRRAEIAEQQSSRKLERERRRQADAGESLAEVEQRLQELLDG